MDLVYYGNQGRLESDYIVAPGADTRQTALRIEGADELKLNATGDAVISTTGGEISLHRPRAYQESNGERREIAANYVRHGSRVLGIHVGQYDPQQPLIIDPVVDYATFLGGTGVHRSSQTSTPRTKSGFVWQANRTSVPNGTVCPARVTDFDRAFRAGAKYRAS